MDTTISNKHRKFNVKKDSFFKRKKIEDAFFPYNKVDFIFCLSDECLIALNSSSKNLYHFGYFFKSRYINQAMKVLPELEQVTETNMSNLFKKAQDMLKKQNKQFDSRDSNIYDTYRPTNRRRLKDMLTHLIGKKNTDKMLKNNGSFKFGLIEFLFFSFLLDTYSERDAKKFRKRKFSEVSESYHNRLKRGVEILFLLHSFSGDPQKIINSWHYEADISKQKLKNELVIFKKAIKNALKAAYSSDETKIHVDYIRDIVSDATKRINNINK